MHLHITHHATILLYYVHLLQERMGKGRLFHSQKNLPDMDRRCEHPWRDLFIWAILQNRQEMANYFWAMVGR